MSDDTATGIPNPDKPGHWLVPPWPTDTSFCDVVRHFLRHHPWGSSNTAHLLAYFEGYDAALDAAPTEELAYVFRQRWCADMRNCIARCVRLYRERRTAENRFRLEIAGTRRDVAIEGVAAVAGQPAA